MSGQKQGQKKKYIVSAKRPINGSVLLYLDSVSSTHMGGCKYRFCVPKLWNNIRRGESKDMVGDVKPRYCAMLSLTSRCHMKNSISSNKTENKSISKNSNPNQSVGHNYEFCRNYCCTPV